MHSSSAFVKVLRHEFDVNSIYDSRKYLISFSVVSVMLILWLTVSFWWNAYVQRHDALQVQALSSIEDKLFDLADALGQERSHLFNLLSIDIADSLARESYANSVKESDSLFQAALQTMSVNTVPRLPGSHGDQIKGYIESSRESLALLSDDLQSYRDEFNDRSRRESNFLSSEDAIEYFERYSYLINAIGTVRREIQFAPPITGGKTPHHVQFIDSVWMLKESSLQTAVLLENKFVNIEDSNSELDNQSHRLLLQKLNYRTAVAVEEIRTLGPRYRFGESIELTRKWEAEQYLDEYLVLSESLVELLSNGSVTKQELNHWVGSLNELHDFAHYLRTESTKLNLAEISAVEKKATTNLIIDTFLLMLCIAMAIFSFRYYRRMHHLANYDELSGLNNRRSFTIVAESMMESVRNADEKLAVLFIDLDKFKYINDSMGHTVGDKLLQEFSTRLVSFCKNENHLARIGGDEFAVLKKYTYTSELDNFAETLSQHVREPYCIDRGFLQIGASIGISQYPTDAKTVSELMKNADLAMYCAKTQGRNKIVSFNADLRADYEHKVSVESDLQLALRDNQFELYYQPKFNVATDSIDSVEALIRWNHPDRGMISPDNFIPVAEECGLLQLMGMWVLEEACRQAAEWIRAGERPIRVAVNVSADQFLQPDFVSNVQKCLQQHELPAKYLELELTESVVMNDVDLVVEALSILRDTGIKIALDDFGTGYSSLSYLRSLPIDTLKIDKSFIQSMEMENDQQSSIAQTVAVLAESLGLDTVAEGVETGDQLNAVINMGISSVQGYYYSKPLAAVELQKTIAKINQIAHPKQGAA